MYKDWKTFKRDWVKALRSGEYKQGTGVLCQPNNPEYDRFCCLGVAANLLIENGHRLKWEMGVGKYALIGKPNEGGQASALTIEERVPKWLKDKLRGGSEEDDSFEGKLMWMNDSGKSFKRIATFIEKNM
jgi:hypothetical protein